MKEDVMSDIRPNLAPIVLFVYRRPDHTKKTIDCLLKSELASQSQLFIFSDGAKNENELPAVEATRRYVESIEGFASLTVIKRERNIGLRANLSDGITQIMSRFDRAIILEDDLVLSKYFLNYMNDGLELYKDDENVSGIYAFTHPQMSIYSKKLPSSFFLPNVSSWGWGTWARAWEIYDKNTPEELMQKIQSAGLQNKLNFDGTYNFFGTLRAQVEGRVDSWATQWRTANIIADRIGLFPSVSFVGNEGFDGSGTHVGKASSFSWEARSINGRLAESYTPLTRIPVEINQQAMELHKKVYRKLSGKPPIIIRIIRKILRAPKKLYRIIFQR